jgi:hypothetical protein
MSDSSKPQPWHAADEKPRPSRGGAPIGTHSLTGGGTQVGLPVPPPRADGGEPERSAPRDTPPGAQEPDPLAEPRANLGELLGRRP